LAVHLRQLDGVGEASHPPAGQKAGQHQPAVLTADRVPLLELGHVLVLAEGRIEFGAVGHDRQVEGASPQRPAPLVPLGRDAIGVAPGVGGVVESPGVDQRPVHEVAARVVGVCIGVEDIDHREPAHPEHQAVGGPRAAQLVLIGIDRLALAAQIDGLAEKEALQPEIGRALADLIGLAARKAGDAERAVEPEPLVDLRVDPHLGAAPWPQARIEGRIEGLAALGRRQAVLPDIGRAEVRHPLVDEGRLGVDGEGLVLGRG